MWVLETKPGSFYKWQLLLTMMLSHQLPKLSKMNYIHVLYILIIVHFRQKFYIDYLTVYMSLIMHWLSQNEKKTLNLHKVAEYKGKLLQSIKNEGKKYL